MFGNLLSKNNQQNDQQVQEQNVQQTGYANQPFQQQSYPPQGPYGMQPPPQGQLQPQGNNTQVPNQNITPPDQAMTQYGQQAGYSQQVPYPNSMQQNQNQASISQQPQFPQEQSQSFVTQSQPEQQSPVPPQNQEQTVQAETAPQEQGTSTSEVGMSPDKRQNFTVLSRLDPRATQVLHQATEETKRIKQALIEPEQLLYGLLYDKEIYQLLEQFSVDVASISKELQTNERVGEFTGQPTLSEQSKRILENAFEIAKSRASSFISPEDMLISLFSAASSASTFLDAKGIKKTEVEDKLAKSATYQVGKRSLLDKYGTDLTEQARQGALDPVTGRDKELERLIHILLRRTKNNPILIGEAGVGKTAIVEYLAQKIVEGQVPKDLQNKKIIQLEMASLIAGASHRGEFEERLRNVIREAQASSGEKILFIDEIHTLVGAGDSDGAMDASNIIKPYLARGSFQVIGTTTTAEYRKYFEKDKAFARRFQAVIVDEPEVDVAIDMMNVIKSKYEKYHGVTFSNESIESAVKLSKKYVGERMLPDKGVDVIDEAAAEVKLLYTAGKRDNNQVKQSDVEKVISSWTGIPITKLTEDESQKLLKLEDLIHKRLIDQEEAVKAVSEAVRRGRIGLANTNRPIASFIFLGPTGVGKTELAKTLAEILFGRDDAMVRLDMSEYMEKHEVAKLIGAPPGYVGYEEGGQLTEAVRQKPYSIVLLDEVEKAHPDVFNILLQLLEDGRLTDNKGNTISFKNTIVIGTSNLGSSLIQQKLLSGTDHKSQDQIKQEFKDLKETLQEELLKFFKPELLNRFDGAVIFKPLSRSDMNAVTRITMKKTRKLLKEQGFDLDVTDRALAQLAQEGYDPVYGARPLRRLIQASIENPISVHIIGKTFSHGDVILIDYDPQKQEFSFVKKSDTSPNRLEIDPLQQQTQQEKQGDEKTQQQEGQAIQSPSNQQVVQQGQESQSQSYGGNYEQNVQQNNQSHDQPNQNTQINNQGGALYNQPVPEVPQQQGYFTSQQPNGNNGNGAELKPESN